MLIVEDDYLVSLTLERHLADSGFDVLGVAATADEAIALAQRARPDVAVVDIRLADQRDGIEAATVLSNTHGILCIFASAHTDAATRKRAEQAKPAGWVTKPYAPEDVVSAIHAVLASLKQ